VPVFLLAATRKREKRERARERERRSGESARGRGRPCGLKGGAGDVTVLPVSCPLWSALYPIYYLPSCTYLP
jgi:hypothetical protein